MDGIWNRQGIATTVIPVSLPPPNTTPADFWSLYPPAASQNTIPPTNASQSITSNSTSSASLTNSTSFAGSQTSSSSSYSPSASSSDSNTEAVPQFKFVNLLPVIIVAGVIFLIALIWLIQGCLTRKPRVIDGNSEPLGGPPYVPIDEDTKTLGVDEAKEDDLADYLPYYHTNQTTYHNVQNQWPTHGYPAHLSDQVHHNYVCPPPAAPQKRVSRSARTMRFSRRKTDDTSLSVPVSTTSAALLEMYESDDEKDAERRKETPWETLRHHSIRRGILENVRKEKNWMDSIRAVAGSTFVNQARSSSSDEESRSERVYGYPGGSRDAHTVNLHSSGSRARPSVGKFRRERRELAQDSPHTNTDSIPNNRVWTQETGFKIVQESPVSSPLIQNLAGWGRTERANNMKPRHSPPPSKAPGISGSTPARLAIPKPAPQKDARISILPLSPPVVTSPPLENQLMFTPIPGIEGVMQNVVAGGGRDGGKRISISVAMDSGDPMPDPRGTNTTRPEKRRKKPVKMSKGYQPLSAGT